MATSNVFPPTLDTPASLDVSIHGRAFGMEIESNVRFDSIAETAGETLERRVSLEVEPPGALKGAWRPSESRILIDATFRPGRPMMRIEAEPEIGYRIWAPGHGRHLVSPDGTRIRSSVPRLPDRRWERLLMAQPLPLAALLQGLELFHASSIVIGGRAIAFVAESGTGKTSLATHLVAGGAEFMTDDVLALEVADGKVIAHPGATVLHVSKDELGTIEAERRERIGVPVGEADKVQIAVPADSRPRELAAVYFLSRGEAFRNLEIRDVSPPEPRRLLASSFIAYLETPARLLAGLEFCADFARLIPAFQVSVPTAFGAAALADEIRTHIEGAL